MSVHDLQFMNVSTSLVYQLVVHKLIHICYFPETVHERSVHDIDTERIN